MRETSNYKKYISNNPIQRILINNFRKTLLLCLRDLEIDNVLDAGCGEGFILAELKRHNIGKHLEGIDFSNEALSIGEKYFPYLNLKHGDIYSLPYHDNSFDLVICTEVLEHLERPNEAINEIKRISKKYCLFSVPNEPLFRISNFTRGKNMSRWGNDVDHVQCWSSKDFEILIKRELEILSVKNPFPWTMVLSRKKS